MTTINRSIILVNKLSGRQSLLFFRNIILIFIKVDLQRQYGQTGLLLYTYRLYNYNNYCMNSF